MNPQTPPLPNSSPEAPVSPQSVDPQVAQAAGTPPLKRNSFVMSFIPKKPDLVKFAPFVLVLFLIASLPLAVFLVKRRQEPTEAEVSPGQVTDKCGHVTLGPVDESYDSATSTYTLTVPIKNNRDSPLKVNLRWESYYCREGNLENCDQHRETVEEEIALSSGERKVLQRSVQQKLGDDCGSLQIDVGVLSVNGDRSCTTIGRWETAVWGVHNTGKDCVGGPTPPPGQHPDCTRLDGPSSAAPGQTITFTAHPSGANLDRVEFWLISEEDVNKHTLCPPSQWAPEVWTLVDKDIDGSNGWSAQWDTTGYSEGKYFIAANVYSVYGDENWWCTGNPEGPCNNDPKGVSCPDCSKWITLTTWVPTLTPTPILTPTPSLTPTPVPTAPPEYSCLCDQVIADKDLEGLEVGDVINLTGFGKTNHPETIGKIKFIISKDGMASDAQEVSAVLDREEAGWRFYKADFSYTVQDYGDYEVAIQVECPQGWQD